MVTPAEGTGLGLGLECPGCSSWLTLSAAEVAELEAGDVLACQCCGAELLVTAGGRAGLKVRARGPVFSCPGCSAHLEAPAALVACQGSGELAVICPSCDSGITLRLRL